MFAAGGGSLKKGPMMTEGQDEILRIASMTGFSEGAVRAMVEALRAGGGTMAQFDHPELGGFGQWSSGGMLMIGDMFNNSLKGRVAHLADMASAALYEGRLPVRQNQGQGQGMGMGQVQSQGMGGMGFGFGGGGWWPDELGQPSSSGSQNGVRYAVFPGTRRLALDTGSGVRVYDTGDHQIGGVSQQQGGTSSLRFTSQFGTIAAEDLPLVSGGDNRNREPTSPQPGRDPDVAADHGRSSAIRGTDRHDGVRPARVRRRAATIGLCAQRDKRRWRALCAGSSARAGFSVLSRGSRVNGRGKPPEGFRAG